jgi:hypothetical protein
MSYLIALVGIFKSSHIGWELPQSWTEEDVDGKGPANYGYLALNYTSDPSRGCAPVWQAREELTFARCLAGSRGTFMRGLNVRPKSKLKRTVDQNDLVRYRALSMTPMYENIERGTEIESDIFHDRCKSHVQKFMGDKSKFQRAYGKF